MLLNNLAYVKFCWVGKIIALFLHEVDILFHSKVIKGFFMMFLYIDNNRWCLVHSHNPFQANSIFISTFQFMRIVNGNYIEVTPISC